MVSLLLKGELLAMGKLKKQVYSSEEIDEILKSHPPVYSSRIYFSTMAKKLGTSEQIVENKCIKLGLINIKISR